MNILNNKERQSHLCLFLVFLYSVLINQYFGNMGLHALDSTIGLANSHRINSGQIPFEDFWVTSGFLTDIFQSLIFWIFAESWQYYVLHASLFNSLFACSIFIFLKYLNFNNSSSLIYGLSSGTLMYPLSGVLIVDFHSLIISVIGLLLFAYAVLEKKIKIILIIPLIFLTAFLCKQIPAGYFILSVFFISLIYSYKYRAYWLLTNLFLGSFISIIFYSFLIYLLKIDFNNFYIQYIDFALSIFDNSKNDSFFLQLKEITKIKYFLIVLFLYVINLVIGGVGKNNKNFLIFLIILSSSLVIFFVEIFTNNQNVMLGILPLLIALIATQFNEVNYKNYKIFHYLFFFIILIFSVRLLSVNINYLSLFIIIGIFFYIKKIKYYKIINLFIIINIVLSFIYFDKFVKIRRFNDVFNTVDEYVEGATLSKKLFGLRWKTNIVDTEFEIKRINYILNHQSVKQDTTLIITNLQIYNFILNKKNNSPVKYWMENKSYPSNTSIHKKSFDSFFKSKINKNRIKKIIIVEDTDFNLNDFIWLKNCLFLEENEKKDIKIFNLKENCL